MKHGTFVLFLVAILSLVAVAQVDDLPENKQEEHRVNGSHVQLNVYNIFKVFNLQNSILIKNFRGNFYALAPNTSRTLLSTTTSLEATDKSVSIVETEATIPDTSVRPPITIKTTSSSISNAVTTASRTISPKTIDSVTTTTTMTTTEKEMIPSSTRNDPSSPSMTTVSTTTGTPSTTIPASAVRSFRGADYTPVMVSCGSHTIRILSASYGNADTCGPYDVTANLTLAAMDIQFMIIMVESSTMQNLCPNSTNQLIGRYYCDISSTPSSMSFVLSNKVQRDIVCHGNGKVTIVSSDYVQPSCIISPIPELAHNNCPAGQLSKCPFTADSTSVMGNDNPPGCRTAFASMFAKVKYTCQ